MENLQRVKELARDLRREEPRSAQEELGGESHAARCLDKCRASLVGWSGEYQFGCPMDLHFFEETGIKREEFSNYVATGATDEEVGEWIKEHSTAQQT